MDAAWDIELAQFLAELSAAQEETLRLLSAKRALLIKLDTAALAAMTPQEELLVARLQACQKRREELLERAAKEGVSVGDLSSLVHGLPADARRQLSPQFEGAAAQMRLLQHESLASWVLVQRTLLHLGQMLEIIATGGRLQPTYGIGEPAAATGSLVDRAA